MGPTVELVADVRRCRYLSTFRSSVIRVVAIVVAAVVVVVVVVVLLQGIQKASPFEDVCIG